MTEPHSSSSTSNSLIQTQLPHICTPAASLGNPRQVGWLAKKNKKKELYLWLLEQQNTSGFESVERWDRDSKLGRPRRCFQNVTNPNGAAEMRVCLGGEQEES